MGSFLCLIGDLTGPFAHRAGRVVPLAGELARTVTEGALHPMRNGVMTGRIHAAIWSAHAAVPWVWSPW